MTDKLQMSFEPAYEDDPSPFTVIYNPRILPSALFSQVSRFGLLGGSGKKLFMSGKLNGSRMALTEMIHTYGLTIEVIRANYTSQTGATLLHPSRVL